MDLPKAVEKQQKKKKLTMEEKRAALLAEHERLQNLTDEEKYLEGLKVQKIVLEEQERRRVMKKKIAEGPRRGRRHFISVTGVTIDGQKKMSDRIREAVKPNKK